MAEKLPKLNFLKSYGRVRRFGCIVAVVLWFVVLLTPCLCIVLATQGEIAIRLGDVPGQSVRLWLVNESRQRGLGISRPTIYPGRVSNQLCIQTNVSFLLWVGTEEAATYCECYTRPENITEWELNNNQAGACQP